MMGSSTGGLFIELGFNVQLNDLIFSVPYWTFSNSQWI
ncbi:hypothetical protein GARC_1712 [Paraglaciecola arctica BSs20135]|uniref:Uncharacterized protein n=1 Tax=Paraglaciecola arctica BSs20135 TaxID=493475 RepID=K6XDG1_9ALTE|nr:hypothetical protein GARC_1712 [Paraglaciecola arctica BSs20135]